MTFIGCINNLNICAQYILCIGWFWASKFILEFCAQNLERRWIITAVCECKWSVGISMSLSTAYMFVLIRYSDTIDLSRMNGECNQKKMFIQRFWERDSWSHHDNIGSLCIDFLCRRLQKFTETRWLRSNSNQYGLSMSIPCPCQKYYSAELRQEWDAISSVDLSMFHSNIISDLIISD